MYRPTRPKWTREDNQCKYTLAERLGDRACRPRGLFPGRTRAVRDRSMLNRCTRSGQTSPRSRARRSAASVGDSTNTAQDMQ